jgi:hypothetical protein
MSSLPQETTDRIYTAAEKYAFQVPYNGTKEFYNKDLFAGYKAGATAEAEKAHALVVFIEKFISHQEGFLYEEGINVLKSYNDGK